MFAVKQSGISLSVRHSSYTAACKHCFNPKGWTKSSSLLKTDRFLCFTNAELQISMQKVEITPPNWCCCCLVRLHDVVALYCRYAPAAQCIRLWRCFSCHLVSDLPAKAEERPLPWFVSPRFSFPGAFACFWMVGGSRRTRREPDPTRGKHANSTQKGPSRE